MMAGYRDNSGFDPYASPRYGRPLRPYNWVQWTGIGLMVLGLAIYAAYFAGRFGLTRQLLDTPIIGMSPVILGSVLVNSRRETLPDPAPQLAAERKRWLLIVTGLCALVLGIATIFALKGY